MMITRTRMQYVGRLLGLFLCATLSFGGDHCDLKVFLENAKGQPVDDLVSALDSEGNLIARARSEGGVASLCDIGYRRFDLEVRNSYCGKVVLPDVRIASWPYEETLRVVLNPCGAHQMAYNGCIILVRVVDGSGRRLGGVGLKHDGEEISRPSDGLGRIWTARSFGTRLSGVLVKDGYTDELVDLGCTRENPMFEVTITLRAK